MKKLIAILLSLIMVISLFAGVVFLGEPFGALSLLASVMIVLGIWGVQILQTVGF